MSGAALSADTGVASAAPALWSVVFGGSTGYLCAASGQRHPGSARLADFQERYFRYPEEADLAASWCAEQAEAGREVYFCAHLLTEPRRAKETAAPLSALYADGDGAEVPEEVPEPSVVVESSPGRTQFYWTLTQAVEPGAGERFNKRLAHATGSDMAGWDLTQLLRVPGTANHKYPDGPVVALREVTGEVHDPERIGRELPEPPEDVRGDTLAEPISPEMGDEEVLARCREAGNAEKFSALFDEGELAWYEGDHSAADFGLCWLIGFWTQDREQIDRLFRRSALMRPKWERESYREPTIGRALPEDRDYYGDKRKNLNIVFGDDFEGEIREGAPDENHGGATSATVPLDMGADPPPTASVPVFPVDALPAVLRRLAVEAAHAKETPVDFVATPMLPALGVAIGSSRAIELTRTYRESAIVWTAVVAPPASGKSPAEDVAMEPVEHQRKVYAHEHRLALEKWKEEHQTWELAAAEARKKKKRIPPEPEKPTKRRIRVGDTTLEALLLRLTENPRGLILGRDELAGFVNSLGQYKGGKGADREAWLSLHSGKTPPLDRKSADESFDIFFPHVSVVGSIQPSKLKVFDISAGDGLIERVLVSYPEAEIPPEAEEDISLAAEEGYRRVWDKLHALEPAQDGFGQPAPKGVPLTPGAREAWKGYRNALKREAFQPGTPEYVQGVIGKLRGYLARFSLILALVRTAEDGEATEEVRRVDVERAWALVGYFLAHARRVYEDLRDEAKDGGRKDIRLARALGEFLEERGGVWEGPATELYGTLKEAGHAEALPKTPDSLTEAVIKVARKTPALHAEKKRSGGKRRICVTLSSGADPAIGIVAYRHSGTYGADGSGLRGSGTSAHSGTYSDKPGEGATA